MNPDNIDLILIYKKVGEINQKDEAFVEILAFEQGWCIYWLRYLPYR